MVIDVAVTERMPDERRIDGDHRLVEPALRGIGETDHREVGPDLEDSFDVGAVVRLFEEHHLVVQKIYPRAFPDLRRRNPRLLVKAVARYLLGRLGEPLVGPNLYFRAIKPSV